MFKMVATVVVTDTLSQMVSRQPGRRLDHCALTVYPLWLNRVKPGTPAWQEAGNELHPRFAAAYSTVGEYLLVVRSYPVELLTADMPLSIVPHKHQYLLALRS